MDILEVDEYHRKKAEHDFVEDQVYAMSRECMRCQKLCPPHELQDIYDTDEEWCDDCVLRGEVEAERAKDEEEEND